MGFNLKKIGYDTKTYDVYTWSTEEEIGKYGNHPFMFKENVSRKEALEAEDMVLCCSDCTHVKTVVNGKGFKGRTIDLWN